MEGERRWRALERAAWAPPLIVAVLVWLAGSDVPYWDDWELNSILAKAREGSVSAGDLFALHNGHPIALSRVILTGVALATGWNVRAQLLVNVGVMLAALFMVLLLASRHRSVSRRAIAAAGSAVALFSLSQYENLLWAWQLGFFLAVALITAAVAVLAATRWPVGWRIAIAAALCLLGSFSSGLGVAGWIALTPLVATTVRSRGGNLRAAIGASLLWLILGSAATLISLAPGGATDHILPLTTTNLILFFFSVAGTPWTTLPLSAAFLGALTVALFLFLAWHAVRKDPLASMPWVSLGLVALGFAGLAAIARAPFGWEGGSSARYATPAILLVVAAMNLAAGWLPEKAARQVAGGVALLALLASLTFALPFWSFAAARHEAAVCTDLVFLMSDRTESCLDYGDPRFRAWASFARERELRSFADGSWFGEEGEDEGTEVRIGAGSPPIIRGALGPRLFRSPLLITTGARQPIAVTWSDRTGRWSAPVSDVQEPLEIWTIPLHEKRFARVARVDED